MRLYFIKFIILVISDSAVIGALFFLYTRYHIIHSKMVYILAGCIILMLVVRAFLFFMGNWVYYRKAINNIKEIVSDFKKGKFAQTYREVKIVSDLDDIQRELVTAGRHLDSIMTAQKKEIDNFIELYNSIIFSISSYFIVLDDDDRVLFANEGFYKKFQFQSDEVYSKKIEDIFYFVNARLKGGITQVRQTGKTVVLEKTHLLTLNKISIIADIKISNIVVKDASQIIIIIDDVTKKLRNDYQISLMSQISESIQKDDEIDRVLFTILTGVTSGTGLGFNRAMLYLVEDGVLVGKMAVGPDSFEEAIEIWTAASTASNEKTFVETKSAEMKAGINLLTRVLAVRYPVKAANVFTIALNGRRSVHVADSWNDERVGEDIRTLMDVKEFIVTPLVVVNKGIGIIVADNKFNNAPIMKENIELLSIFASQAAMSIESYSNLDTARSEMQKLSERQEAIVESEKLAAVGRIAAHMAHEIRNPLVTMGGYARRIIQMPKEKSKTAKKIDTSAEIILKECERLEKTLSNVMDFSRPAKFIREFNNINEIIRDTVNLLKNLFQEKKVEIYLELAEEIPLVKSDFNQMKQVMLNLLQNSLDATPTGGRITVSSASDGAVIDITISDNGSGISDEDPNIVFEPFFSTKVTGVGLGLAIVKKIIKDHNGSIRAKNREEGGAEFTIRLPVPG
ncbi:MAG: GAF domain-containing protein [Spirochaetes bacterium]|nr:GAF domain-containing protein [Spirochaetota bacterium]